MPDLTPKQEAFVGAYIETGNATEAYRRSYDVKATTKEVTIRVNAAKLLADTNIALRIQTLRERAAAKAVLTRSFVLEGLMNNAKNAAVKEDYTASNKAYELLGKVDDLQLFVERTNVQSDNRNHHSFDPVSAFDGFLAEASGGRAKVDPEKPVQN